MLICLALPQLFFSLLTSPDGWFPFLELSATLAENRGQAGEVFSLLTLMFSSIT